MSYLTYIYEQAELHDVPKTIFRDMDRIMDSVVTMTHLLDNIQLVEIMVKNGFPKPDLQPKNVDKQNLKLLVMKVMFYNICQDNGIKDDHIFSYITYWNEL